MERKTVLLILVLFIFTMASASAISIRDEDPLKIFPNPAEERLTLELCSDLSALPVINVIDLTGKVVERFEHLFNFKQDAYTAELDISNMKPGVYFIKVFQGETVYSKKLMVK